MAPVMKTIIYPARDLAQAKTLYRALLGVEPYSDEPYYLGFRVGDTEVGFTPHGHAQGLTMPVCYWDVADINEAVAALVAAGAKEHSPVKDVGGGLLVAVVSDADGNLTGLPQVP